MSIIASNIFTKAVSRAQSSHGGVKAVANSTRRRGWNGASKRVSQNKRAYASRGVFAPLDTFVRRHIGSGHKEDIDAMLKEMGEESLESLVSKVVPKNIQLGRRLKLPNSEKEPRGENEALAELKAIMSKNKVNRNFLGMGYYGSILPPVILRNILENPAWYTPYTPYQSEVSQGRLESLLNFQTMVTDLTGLDITGASLLDEATAGAEAMVMAVRHTNKEAVFVSSLLHPQTIATIQTRAEPLNIRVVVGDVSELKTVDHVKDYATVYVSYPNTDGTLVNYSEISKIVHESGSILSCASDLVALTVLENPRQLFEADIVFGSSGRFGLPMGFGGPHAAFLSTRDSLKRLMPGRIIGVSKDSRGKLALRMALGTREQHIRREKATSNICTAQALLANIAAMYAIYHGPNGLKDIARSIHAKALTLSRALAKLGFQAPQQASQSSQPLFFDTVSINTASKGVSASAVIKEGHVLGGNLRKLNDTTITISLDEVTSKGDLELIITAFANAAKIQPSETAKVIGQLDLIGNDVLSAFQAGNSIISNTETLTGIDNGSLNEMLKQGGGNVIVSPIVSSSPFYRKSPMLTHEVFNKFHSEHEMLRYMYRLQLKDIGLTFSMIPLGSCTMKLTSTTEMIGVTWPEVGNVHPFAPTEQVQGYRQMLSELQEMLAEITGFHSVSLQPNAGSQGEFAGLLAIRAYHKWRGDGEKRKICLIPTSAHGTNPASAVMVGMTVKAVKCDENGNVDVADLKAKAEEHKQELACLMITYPSTHGVFEATIKEITAIIHENGGQVYLDGANMNAQVGLCRPGDVGADVCHLNLHKTFAIPHGGGGPGMGPIGVAQHLAPFLPGHSLVSTGIDPSTASGSVSAAPFGSGSILPIPYMYIKMMGSTGLREATSTAILNANYMAKRLSSHYDILYTGPNGFVAHEFILDLRPFKVHGIEAEDVAKRLMDYSFHAPTLSFPVPGTLMIEPTESESKTELDRFIDALLQIRKEIQDVIDGKHSKTTNPLKNAPHTQDMLLIDEWKNSYSREEAAYPLPYLRVAKFWPTVGRVDNTYGDRNLICSCPPMDEY
jgi:glycine dehydrogenase